MRASEDGGARHGVAWWRTLRAKAGHGCARNPSAVSRAEREQQKSPLDRAGCRNKLRPGGEPSLTQGGDERRFRSRRFKICIVDIAVSIGKTRAIRDISIFCDEKFLIKTTIDYFNSLDISS